MPDLETTLHLDMLSKHRRRNTLPRRVAKSLRTAFMGPKLYGMQWGDPQHVPPLRYVRDTYLKPYVKPDHHGLEIGPGGGRWTQYMLDFKHLTVVDFHGELLDELRKHFKRDNMTFIKNNGTDFPGVDDASIDFVFSFGVFVHLDLDIIDGYLGNLRRILKPTSNVLLQYADKTKIMAKDNSDFSDNDPEKMRALINKHDYTIVEEDLTTMWHSGIVRFTL